MTFGRFSGLPMLSELPPAELRSLRRTLGGSCSFVLVAEDHPPLLEVIGRHLDGHPISGQRLDAVPFHLSRRIGDDCMSDVRAERDNARRAISRSRGRRIGGVLPSSRYDPFEWLLQCVAPERPSAPTGHCDARRRRQSPLGGLPWLIVSAMCARCVHARAGTAKLSLGGRTGLPLCD